MSISILEQNVDSPETPGTKNFAPFEASAELEAIADKRISAFPAEHKRAAVLPLIHEIQHRHGFISAAAIDWISAKLDLEPIRVLEVVTFYPGIRQSAPGKYHIRVCHTLSCAMGGSIDLMDKLCELTGIDRSDCDSHTKPIAVSPCGTFSVEFSECLASCGTAPVCMVNDDFHEAIAPDKAEALLDQYRKQSN